MVCVKVAKGLILDIRILKLLISYKSKIHVTNKIERKIKESYIVGLTYNTKQKQALN